MVPTLRTTKSSSPSVSAPAHGARHRCPARGRLDGTRYGRPIQRRLAPALAATILGAAAPALDAQWHPEQDAEICVAGTGRATLDIAVCTRALRGHFDAATRATLLNARGAAHRTHGARNRSIRDFTAALALNPGSAAAHHGRALARREAGEYDLAHADLTTALELSPRYHQAYRDRGITEFFRGRPEAAIRDLNAALDLYRFDPEALAFRGLARYLRSEFEAAEEDWVECEQMGLDYLYLPLWLHLARARRDASDRAALESAVQALRPGAWPRPLLLAYLGATSPREVIQHARQGAAALGAARVRASQFYLGELALTRGDERTARARFEASLAGAPAASVEAVHARDGLVRLSGR